MKQLDTHKDGIVIPNITQVFFLRNVDIIVNSLKEGIIQQHGTD